MTHVVLVKLKGSVSKSHESQKRDRRKWGGGSRDGKEIREGVGESNQYIISNKTNQ